MWRYLNLGNGWVLKYSRKYKDLSDDARASSSAHAHFHMISCIYEGIGFVCVACAVCTVAVYMITLRCLEAEFEITCFYLF